MENINDTIDQVAKEHFSHLTPGTPDHFTFYRFLTALKARFATPETVEKAEQPSPPETD